MRRNGTLTFDPPGAFKALAAILLLALALALPALPLQAQGMQQVRFQSSAPDRAQLQGRLHTPARRGPAPAIVLMHGCGGWQPDVLSALEDYARFFQANGFVVLNLDSFGPRGNAGGRVCASLGELARARDYRTHDAFSALNFLRSQPFVDGHNVFLVGQSNGGSVAMITALARTVDRFGAGFRGTVALYPWCGAAGSNRLNLHAPLMVLGGERDDWTPQRDCTRLRSTGPEVTVRLFPHAAHSYDVRIPVHRYMGYLVGYNPQAAAATRTEMLAFFQRLSRTTQVAMR